ncbi:MAG TPA: DUF5709 domain-containing protein [Nocardioides sp.]|jgi:hypothetical protein|nr:DUF5709 domain-containing protein [Nocardioides sp.]
MSSSFSDDQLQPDDTLDDRGVDDVLDEGMSPPERPSREMARGITAREDAEGESLTDRLEQEEPDPAAEIDHTAQAQRDEIQDGSDPSEGSDPSDGFEIGDERTGRLTESEGDPSDDVAQDVGIDGSAASAEEAAMHTIDEDEA